MAKEKLSSAQVGRKHRYERKNEQRSSSPEALELLSGQGEATDSVFSSLRLITVCSNETAGLRVFLITTRVLRLLMGSCGWSDALSALREEMEALAAMFCPFCGQHLGTVQVFCGSCGKNVQFLAEVEHNITSSWTRRRRQHDSRIAEINRLVSANTAIFPKHIEQDTGTEEETLTLIKEGLLHFPKLLEQTKGDNRPQNHVGFLES
ncbi:hypothetical protein F7725_017509 [Dissostichus mawsoni]|uniref:Uncharacterized protein n=1 Tax=Dissostichus mawsoni TaxID=36200 RepID=A0A7J5Z586_DISMA|nr:hypothetical protein F7725_017509 [Dissostichus mawsoni]